MAIWAGYVQAVYGKQFVVKIGSKHRRVLEWVDQALFKESKEEEEIKKRVCKRKRESWNTEEDRRERKWEAN